MNQPPRRLVSLVPSTTESVVAWCGAAAVVGCTRYCTEPAGALVAAARIGGTKNPRLEAILALAPDLVLGNAEENRAEDLEWLAARVPVHVQTPTTVAGARDALAELATVLGVAAIAQPWLDRLDAELQVAPPAVPVPVFYAIWRKPWMSVNQRTYIHDVLRLAGAANVTAAHAERYPSLDERELGELGAAAVLLPDEPWVFDAAQRDELARQRCFGRARLSLCDGKDFCWHGVRAAAGLSAARRLVRELAASLAPA